MLYLNAIIVCYSFRGQQDSIRSEERLKSSLDLQGSEKQQLEKVRITLNDQIDGLTGENQKLQAVNAELQRQRDCLEDEKEDVIKDKLRQTKENERWYVP